MLRTLSLVSLLALPLAALPQSPAPAAGAPTPAPFVIPKAPSGTLAWETLQQAKTVQKADKKFGPLFTHDIKALDRKDVKPPPIRRIARSAFRAGRNRWSR